MSPTVSICGRDIQFNTRVERAVFDEAASLWSVTTSDGNTVSAKFFVLATGCLSNAKMPDIKGLDRFKGKVYHTGHWPHEEVDFTGLRVGVIGTGSSAIQSVPIIAEQASQLTVFQRTANFSIPARNAALTRRGAAVVPLALSGNPAVRPRGRAQRHLHRSARARRARRRRQRAPLEIRGALGPRRADLHVGLQQPRAGAGGQRHRRRFRPREDRRDRQRIPRPQSCCSRTTIRSAPSASASTRIISRPSTGRTSALVDIKLEPDRGNHRTCGAHRRQEITKSTRWCSPPASTP